MNIIRKRLLKLERAGSPLSKSTCNLNLEGANDDEVDSSFADRQRCPCGRRGLSVDRCMSALCVRPPSDDAVIGLIPWFSCVVSSWEWFYGGDGARGGGKNVPCPA